MIGVGIGEYARHDSAAALAMAGEHIFDPFIAVPGGELHRNGLMHGCAAGEDQQSSLAGLEFYGEIVIPESQSLFVGESSSELVDGGCLARAWRAAEIEFAADSAPEHRLNMIDEPHLVSMLGEFYPEGDDGPVALQIHLGDGHDWYSTPCTAAVHQRYFFA
jgi:hypothetical protein